MSDLRSRFEEIKMVSSKLKYVWWNEDRCCYCDIGNHPSANAQYLNGAWWMFQELNK